MMKFTTKGIYGIMILLDLACYGSNGPQSIKQIAERTKISEKYLEQIFIRLKKTGYIRSYRGKKGGYDLMLPPADISIGKALAVLEGSYAPVDCISPPGEKECVRSNICITKLFWQKLLREISAVIDNTTLENLQIKFMDWKNNKNSMYYI